MFDPAIGHLKMISLNHYSPPPNMSNPPSMFCIKGETLCGPKILTLTMWYKQSTEKWNLGGRIFFRIINFLETSQNTLPTSLSLIFSKILLHKVNGYILQF